MRVVVVRGPHMLVELAAAVQRGVAAEAQQIQRIVVVPLALLDGALMLVVQINRTEILVAIRARREIELRHGKV